MTHEKFIVEIRNMFPALLADHHHLTNLIIQEANEKALHNGLKSTLNEVRSSFWVTRGEQSVKKVIRGGTTCIRFESKHYQYPAPPYLPDIRVVGSEAFESVWTDLACPSYTKHTSGKKEFTSLSLQEKRNSAFFKI